LKANDHETQLINDKLITKHVDLYSLYIRVNKDQMKV